MKAIKIWFPMHSAMDTVMSINGFTSPIPTGMPVFPVVPASMSSNFWIENNTDGLPQLCSFKTSAEIACTVQFLDATTGLPYALSGQPFSAVQVGDDIIFKPQ